eukprot:UN06825
MMEFEHMLNTDRCIESRGIIFKNYEHTCGIYFVALTNFIVHNCLSWVSTVYINSNALKLNF